MPLRYAGLLCFGSEGAVARHPLMSLRRTLAFALATAALAPGTAGAADVQVVARDVPLAAVRGSVARAAPLEFTMVGTHWQGGGEVWFRTASKSGTWSPWRLARPEEDDLPDATSDEGEGVAGLERGNPWWTGASTSIQYRVSGPVTRLRTFYISSEPSSADATLAAPAAGDATARPAADHPASRLGRRRVHRPSAAVFADSLELSVVHHTAGTNSYSAAQSAAIVRGIQRYHVLSNGWNDIGYNFLVDKYGRIFEGRGGGIQNVIGAHAQGFNTGSVGVAASGRTDRAASPPPRGALAAARLAARRRPRRPGVAVSTHLVRQRSLPRGPRGAPAGGLGTPGHRLHELPGNGALRAAPGSPRTSSRSASRSSTTPRRRRWRGWRPPLHRAPLEPSLSWTVTIRLSPTDRHARAGIGTGTTVDWTWDATRALPTG